MVFYRNTGLNTGFPPWNTNNTRMSGINTGAPVVIAILGHSGLRAVQAAARAKDAEDEAR